VSELAVAPEFETKPVAPEQLQEARQFAASYAGEHVAGTEFVIGALFVAWGVSTHDILYGLLLGNLMAVLTWGLITAPIATDTRLTLYAYLEKIAGPGTIKLYSIINGILFAILAGAMITVSASAVRVLLGISPQVNWYPTDISFVLVAVTVGTVVVIVAAKGFKVVAHFSEICAPWMILMFIAGALAVLPVLVKVTNGVESIGALSDFVKVADEYIWVRQSTDVGFWHVAAFAWVANLAMHGSLGDMTLLRFARKSSYGYFSALGMFIGHYLAWICAGIMGAGVALILKSSIGQLDPGEVAFQSLGIAGVIAVIIAGWTTSNPTIYRAGLAFQSLNHEWGRTRVTVIAGIATTAIACFPFVFTKLLGFVGIMGLMLAPVGAVMVTEHWIFPRIGFTRYWSHYRKNTTNFAAVLTWVVSLILALYLERSGTLHLFFLLIPIWSFATLSYIGLASVMGAKDAYAESAAMESAEKQRQLGRWLIAPTLIYFVSATVWISQKEKQAEEQKSVT
jgi:NCS1 family nucleobase:cation symporter-1